MDKEAFEKHKPFAGEKKPSMLRRRVGHDYESRRIYLITMTIERRRPLLGTLTGDADAPDGSPEAPRLEPSPLGLEVQRCWRAIHDHYPEVDVLALQLMPDHLHGILFVTRQMEQHLGMILKGFKAGCNKAYRALCPAQSAYAATLLQQQKPDREHGLLFSRNYNDHILDGAGELQHWFQYLHDNPRRLAARRKYPALFSMHRQTKVCGLSFTSMGNHYLLDRPGRQLIEISRKAGRQETDRCMLSALAAARHGAVTYTAAISPGEKAIARAIRQQGFPLVVLLSDGFPPEGSPHERYYKPSGVYFDACAKGLLLLLEPDDTSFLLPALRAATEQALRRKAEAKGFPYAPIPVTSRRYRFVALNEMGRMMVER